MNPFHALICWLTPASLVNLFKALIRWLTPASLVDEADYLVSVSSGMTEWASEDEHEYGVLFV